METLALVVGGLMTGFYSFALYHGVYFSDDETISLVVPVGNPLDFADGSISGDLFGAFTTAGASEGPVGLLLGFILDIIVCLFLSFVVAFLFWLGVNLLLIGVVIVVIPLYYIFKRSVLFVMRHTEECHGNLWRSLGYGLSYAVLKTALLCLIVFASHELAQLIKFHVLPGGAF